MPGLPYWCLMAALALISSACRNSESVGQKFDDVLVTVNGAPIREADVLWRAMNEGHRSGPQPSLTPEMKKNLLEALIAKELFAQRAVEMGLDDDRAYLEQVRQAEAQFSAVRRNVLAQLFLGKQARPNLKTSEAMAHEYYNANAAQIRTEAHLLQIMRRSQVEIDKAHAALAAGKTFEEVASEGLPGPTPGGKPAYDLGYLNGLQVPEAWRPVIQKLKPGETSSVIRGPKERFWILKLVDRRENQELTFDAVKAVLMAQLKGAETERLRQDLEAGLRAKASIRYH